MQYFLHVNGAGPGMIFSILRSEHFILLEAICWCLFFVQHNILRYSSEDSIATYRSAWIYVYMGSPDINHVFWEYARKEKKDFSLLNLH